MNNKYKGIAGLAVVATVFTVAVALSACDDDFGNDIRQSGVVSLNVNAPSDWTDGLNAGQNEMSSRCTSVDAVSDDGAVPLYFHTIESDNAAGEIQSRGALKKTVEYFSLSAICYPGAYPDDEKDVEWTPDFAHNLIFKVTGTTAAGSETLQWPAGGRVRFFAFAPLTDGEGTAPFTLSSKTTPGSPSISYTVPSEVKNQYDIMAACVDASSPDVTLEFKHILTAVRIVAASDMLPGKISSVRLSGVYSKGTFTPVPSGGSWAVDKTSAATYSINPDVTLAPGEGGSGYKPEKPENGEIIGDITDKTEIAGEKGDLTFLMMPQVLPEGAVLTVTFTDDLTGTERTLSASLAGKTWSAGKLITYSLSPSSIHIVPTVEFSRTPDDILPYSGVWHDTDIKAYAAVTQDKTEGIKYIELPRPEVEYMIDGSWTKAVFDADPAADAGSDAASRSLDFKTDPAEIKFYNGSFVLGPQSDFYDLSSEFTDRATCLGTAAAPHNLLDDTGGESANCYMIGQPGYYCFPVVYGNAYNNPSAYTLASATDGMNYYVDYKGNRISSQAPETGVIKDAVLAWQDSPDLIDDVKVVESEAPTSDVKWVCFRVRKHSITQGNALIVVRDNTGEIVWSWHIWVSQHTKEWMGKNYASCHKLRSIVKGAGGAYEFTGNTYYLTSCNLGYCDPHNGNGERTFKLRFKIDCSKITGSKTPVSVTAFRKGTKSYSNPDFVQAEFKGSLAGDNTYYQYGRKDPMLGGIYNDKTQHYYRGSDYSELSMENKPTFNVYTDGDLSYDFTRNSPGTSLADMGEENGVLIDYIIKYPYKFIMSKYDDQLSVGGVKLKKYRNHWHKFTSDYLPDYLQSADSKMFQMWNPQSESVGVAGNNAVNEHSQGEKSIYDPCPAGYRVPNSNVFSSLAFWGAKYGWLGRYDNISIGGESYTTSVSHDRYKWIVTYPDGSIEFPATGMRNMAVRYNDLKDVKAYNSVSRADFDDPCDIDKVSLPAFRMITYLTSSTMDTGSQVLIFYIDNRYEYNEYKGTDVPTPRTDIGILDAVVEIPAVESCRSSNNTYGLSVRPIIDD